MFPGIRDHKLSVYREVLSTFKVHYTVYNVVTRKETQPSMVDRWLLAESRADGSYFRLVLTRYCSERKE
jgi:hypothetical protein